MDFFSLSHPITIIVPLLGLATLLGALAFWGISLAWDRFKSLRAANNLTGEHPARPISLHRRVFPRLKNEGLLVTEHGTLLSLVKLHERLTHRYGYATTRRMVISPALAEVLETEGPSTRDVLGAVGLFYEVDPTLPSNKLGIRVSGPGPRRTIWLKARRVPPLDLRRMQLGELTEQEIWRSPFKNIPKLKRPEF